MRSTRFVAICLCAQLAFCASSQQKLQQARAKDPKYQYNLGLVYLNQSNLNPANIDTAIGYFVKALALDTRYYLAWNAIGLAQSLKGKLAEAASAYEKCLEVSPDFTEAHNNLGTIYQELNQLDKAEAEFQKAVLDKLYPTRELPYYNLARLYLVEGRLDPAFENVQNALRIRPRLAMAHNLKGMILERMGKPEDAVEAYVTALRADESLVRGEIFNIVSENVRISELALRVRKTLADLGIAADIRPDYEPRKLRSCQASGKRFRETFDFQLRFSVEDGVRELVDKIRNGAFADIDHPRYRNIQWMEILEETYRLTGGKGSITDLEPVEVTGGLVR